MIEQKIKIQKAWSINKIRMLNSNFLNRNIKKK